MITRDEIKKLAHLARIAVTDQEVDEYTKDFEAILGYVEQINQVVVSDVAPTYPTQNAARLDEVLNEETAYLDRLIANAPDQEAGFYKVPKIL